MTSGARILWVAATVTISKSSMSIVSGPCKGVRERSASAAEAHHRASRQRLQVVVRQRLRTIGASAHAFGEQDFGICG